MNANQLEKFVPPTDGNRAPSAGDMVNPDELKDDLGKIRAPGIVSGAIPRGETAPFSGTTADAGISKWLVSRLFRDRSLFQSTLLRKTRILFVRAMIVVLTVIACFAGFEFVLQRCYSIQTGNWTAFDSIRGWRLVPGEYLSKPPGEVNNVAITINEFGLRSHSLSAPRSRTKNIVVLGDSFVFVSQTALEETFPDRLKRLLNDRVGGGLGRHECRSAGIWNVAGVTFHKRIIRGASSQCGYLFAHVFHQRYCWITSASATAT